MPSDYLRDMKEVVLIVIQSTMTSEENCHHFDNNINPINSCYLLTCELNIIFVLLSQISDSNNGFLLFPIVSILEGLFYFLMYMTALEFI